AEEHMGAILRRGTGDGVADFAAPFVVDCFAAYLGVPAELTRRVREIGVRYGFAIQDMDDGVIAECSAQLYEIAESLYRARLAENPDPSRDIVASLHAAAQDPGNHISERTAIATIRQMIVAGMAA